MDNLITKVQVFKGEFNSCVYFDMKYLPRVGEYVELVVQETVGKRQVKFTGVVVEVIHYLTEMLYEPKHPYNWVHNIEIHLK